MTEKGKGRRGFASMDPEKLRQVSGKGGRAAHSQGKAHRFNSEEASEAGKRGGRTVSRDRQHMAAIGRLGGRARTEKQRRPCEQPDPQPPALELDPVPAEQACEGREIPGTTTPVPAASMTPPEEGPKPGRKAFRGKATSMRVLLENGPFGGCSIHAEAAGVPQNLRIDGLGRVSCVVVEGDGSPSPWAGKTAEPRPVADWSVVHPDAMEFAYDRTDSAEPGFDGVLKFSGIITPDNPGTPRPEGASQSPAQSRPIS